ncbi:MAG TPA: potassium-transporting ATPase subunit KdpA, partial [Candidatus Eremiobacteraceae bacterium]|nr:potassium-transporting ATPase subunit KdpA [Candidatus Eremiobacteraceae bacterium]
MTAIGWLQVLVLFALVLVSVKPLGLFMARIFTGERTFLTPVLAPVENAIFKVCRINPESEMPWYTYLFAALAFSAVAFLFLYVLLRTQAWLPLNPQKFPNMAPDLAFNTAISFTTNTNWQFYAGESSLSYLSQMMGLAWHNFTSAGVGIALVIALIRGLASTNLKTLGNFWADLTRSCLYVLLPISIVGTLLLVWMGMPQNFHPYMDVTSIEGFKQTLTGGAMASQEVIKELGTNGGGFYNANSAHPFENATAWTNFLEIYLLLCLGFA